MKRARRFAAYAQMLRSAALSLQDGVAEDVLLNRLKARVPVCPRDQAHLITGSFDEIVSRLRRLSSRAGPS